MQLIKMYSKILFICLTLIAVNNANDERKSRKGKSFSFNTANDDIRVDLDFSIPFLSIPVKSSLDSLGFPTVNINPASLALGGAVVLGATILLPFLMKDYSKNHHFYKRYTRILDSTKFETDSILSFASEMTKDVGNFRACGLRISCLAAQKNYSEPVKLFNYFLTNELFTNVFNSTVLEDAMLSGINGRDCMTYKPCSMNERFIYNVLSYFATNT